MGEGISIFIGKSVEGIIGINEGKGIGKNFKETFSAGGIEPGFRMVETMMHRSSGRRGFKEEVMTKIKVCTPTTVNTL